MTAIVTGATGFIGRHLTDFLIARGERVIVVGRVAPSRSAKERLFVPFDLEHPDRMDFAALEDVLDDPGDSRLFHLAAAIERSAGADAARLMTANGTATHHLLDGCARLGIRRMVYASSVAVYGQPQDFAIDETLSPAPVDAYGYSKLAGERAAECIALSFDIDVASLRISSPYGPGMASSGILSVFVDRARRGETYGWYGTGTRCQDFIHVDDVVTGFLAASERGARGIFNLCSGKSTSNREIAETVKSLTPQSPSIVGPTNKADPEEGRIWQFNIVAAHRAFGWQPTVLLTDGLRGYIEHLRVG